MAHFLLMICLTVLLGLSGSRGQFQSNNQYPVAANQNTQGSWNNQRPGPAQNDPYAPAGSPGTQFQYGQQYGQQQSGNYATQGAITTCKPNSNRPGQQLLRFCTVTKEEQDNCATMVGFLTGINLRSSLPGGPAPPPRGKREIDTKFGFCCVQAADKLECMKWIGGPTPKADLVLATPGEAYIASQEYKLVPIVTERLGIDWGQQLPYEDQVVAVVPSDRNIQSIKDLRTRKACFEPVGQPAWDHTIAALRQAGVLAAPPCTKNDMDVVAEFFGPSCVPYDTTKLSEEENTNYRKKLCQLCPSMACTITPELSSSQEVLNCLLNSDADVAFVRASVLSNALKYRTFPEQSFNQYQVICPHNDGIPSPLVDDGTRSVLEWQNCYLGRTPAHAWLTRQNIENFAGVGDRLRDIFNAGEKPTTRPIWMDAFFTGKYGDNQRVTKLVPAINVEHANIVNYLAGFTPYMEGKVSCGTQERTKWCTTSKAEQEKCQLMKLAFKAHRLRPELECENPVKNTYVCLDKLQKNQTDLALIDIGDLVVAGNTYNAVQIAQERYLSDAGSGQTPIDEPYSVAVVRDAGITQLANLRDKKACFTGLWESHGFMLPINTLKSAGLVDQGDCHHLEQARNFFGDSCLPGLADSEINTQNEPKEKLCKQCEGGEKGCSRNGDMRFSGATGALRCLREGKGDVAFVPHTALSELPTSETFYLVCNGGSQPLNSYETCNLGKAPGNVLVTNGYKLIQDKRRLQDMILTASKYFSATDPSAQYAGTGLTSSNNERSRKTFKLFGKRTRTETTSYGSTFPSQTGGGYSAQNPTANSVLSPSNVNLATDGEFSLFGPNAYDLRGFGDLNMTTINQALQSYQVIGERSDWKMCYLTGDSLRISGTLLSFASFFALGWLFVQ